MSIVLWLVFGALVGWIASIIMKKNARMGLISNILVGLIGSALGMWLMDITGLGKPSQFSILGFVVSVGGAALLIAIITAFKKR
jgi:uncharacterized membrane protein YeaQ/YmgE (transglycosylase-associated protein family)